MKKIKLTGKYSNNSYTLVDDEDYVKYNKWKWWLDKSGYVIKSFTREGKEKTIRLHREIMGFPKNKEVDHINHNLLDNRKCNLRICTKSENQHNQKVQKRLKSSIYKGVSWHKQKKRWSAEIRLKSKKFYLGKFKSELQAAKAYDKKAKELFGEYAWLNFK